MKYTNLITLYLLIYTASVCAQITKQISPTLHDSQVLIGNPSEINNKEFKSLLSSSIETKNPEKLFALFSEKKLNAKNVTVADLKLFYDNFKTAMWQKHRAQELWLGYVELAEGTKNLYFVNQIEKDILLFDYEPNIFKSGGGFSSPNLYSRNSKLKIIIPWFLRHKSDADFDKLYSKVKKAKQTSILRAMVLFFKKPDPTDKDRELFLASKILQAFNDLKNMNEYEPRLEQLLMYQNNFTMDGSNGKIERNIFKLKDYYDSLVEDNKKGGLTQKQLSMLNKLRPLYKKYENYYK